jgi:uncharacterized protein YjbI with pentapeptide repeats
MKLKITTKDLEAKNACQSGIDEFMKIYKGKASIDWTVEKQIEIFKTPLGKYVGWAYQNDIIPLWSMRDADLYGADLYGANLCDADLRDANLRDANLRDANLCDADLRDADLRDANLCDANLRDANLRDANLRDANLCDADLYGADLYGADLYGAFFNSNPNIPGWKFNNGRLWREE